MKIDDIPLWLLFLGTILLVVGTIELGYLLGKAVPPQVGGRKGIPGLRHCRHRAGLVGLHPGVHLRHRRRSV